MDTITKLKQAGVGAILPGDLPLQAIVPVGDALLASPVTAVEVRLGSHSSAIIHDLRQRARDNMLVGIGGINEITEIDEAVVAGAQFVTSVNLRPSLVSHCQQKGILFLPGVISIFAAQAAVAAGCAIVRLTTGGPAGPAYVQTLCKVLPDCAVVVAGDITAATITAYKQAGASAILASTSLFAGPNQTMADIITRARQMQQAWEK
jgi:2-keto-3-deoxy-6-phosphogluconate aldolase